jgi:hypothetical protein
VVGEMKEILNLEYKIKKAKGNITKEFQETYEYLKKNSSLLIRSNDGRTEVYETEGNLLTVVLLDKKDFWTLRREDDPIKYEMTKIALKDAMTRK